ncbi:hypothetical protein [Mesorhizobium sp. Pch-S]|uniref:hypothetical protein n=1 Tax=Mesorhizobium sp. Pch-S TaxID=2082387 RepID=UPI001010D8FF|nr:hypothetical protein [Mesorhizobium sp. Pch-S]QAZ46128.1 hypothetical protein C1M53_27580 [Mesorhizobium sp. Pch-S]
MIGDDDIPEDVKRGVEKALFGNRTGYPTVSVKKKYRFPGPSERQLRERQDAQMSVYQVKDRGDD